MIYRFIFILFLCFSFGEPDLWVFKMDGKTYTEKDMYGFFGMGEWIQSSKEKKQKMVEDFIIREGAFLQATSLGLSNSPSFYEKSFNKSRHFLVNYVYQVEVSKLALDSNRVALGKTFLKEDRLVHHILIGYNNSALRQPVSRTKEEALSLSLNILDTLSVDMFEEVAFKISDDGAAKRNKGRLGWLSWGTTIPSFEEFVFTAPAGRVVGPVETEFGYHLVLVEDLRPSSFSYLSNDEYSDQVVLKSASRDPSVLKSFSSQYDSLVLEENQVVFNSSLIDSFFLAFNNKKEGKKDVVSLLKNYKKEGVVCVYNKKGVGFDWFISQIETYPPSSRPTITNKTSLYDVFKKVVLQDAAYRFGLKNGYNKKDLYLRWVRDYEKDLLYSAYFKNLVNSVSRPDSSSIKEYYFLNKDEKYKIKKSLKLQELRVDSWSLADSLLNLYIDGVEFAPLVENFSINWDKKTQGIIGPVESSFRGGLYSSYFSSFLQTGDVGEVVQNKDGSFSLMLITKVFPEQFIPIEKVYNKISSLLFKQNQELSKERAIEGFYTNYKITINDF